MSGGPDKSDNMKRRSFIKAVAATGAATLVPAGSIGSLLSSCQSRKAAAAWDFDQVVDRSGTWSGPTKAFNLAGISGTAFCVIPDKEKREKYLGTLRAAKLDEPSIPSIVSTIAAYTSETGWLTSLKSYLEGNIDMLMEFFSENETGIAPIRPQASFLVWLDCRKLGLPQDSLMALFRDKAGVYLSNGASYGQGGEGFVRLNIGCPRSVLRAALNHIYEMN